MQSSPQPSWPLFLSAAWPLVALKLRIKGQRKLPELILEWHVDGLGRPHQHLHHDGTASVTGQDGSGNTDGRVTARAVSIRGPVVNVRRGDTVGVWPGSFFSFFLNVNMMTDFAS